MPRADNKHTTVSVVFLCAAAGHPVGGIQPLDEIYLARVNAATCIFAFIAFYSIKGKDYSLYNI